MAAMFALRGESLVRVDTMLAAWWSLARVNRIDQPIAHIELETQTLENT
jgi:hypothetical protein